MNNHQHEQIQRYLNGQSSAEDAVALREELKKNADLRGLYLDYMNLDVALGAVADATAMVANVSSETAIFPRPPVRLSPYSWRWLAATAACAAAIVFGLLARHRDHARIPSDVAAVTASTRTAISRLRTDLPPVLPAWISPTASLLEEPAFPK